MDIPPASPSPSPARSLMAEKLLASGETADLSDNVGNVEIEKEVAWATQQSFEKQSQLRQAIDAYRANKAVDAVKTQVDVDLLTLRGDLQTPNYASVGGLAVEDVTSFGKARFAEGVNVWEKSKAKVISDYEKVVNTDLPLEERAWAAGKYVIGLAGAWVVLGWVKELYRGTLNFISSPWNGQWGESSIMHFVGGVAGAFGLLHLFGRTPLNTTSPAPSTTTAPSTVAGAAPATGPTKTATLPAGVDYSFDTLPPTQELDAYVDKKKIMLADGTVISLVKSPKGILLESAGKKWSLWQINTEAGKDKEESVSVLLSDNLLNLHLSKDKGALNISSLFGTHASFSPDHLKTLAGGGTIVTAEDTAKGTKTTVQARPE